MSEIDLSEVLGSRAQRAHAEQAAKGAAEAEQAKIEAIKARILEGETTGDTLVDLVIVRNNEFDEETVELYRDLSARVAAHVREPVLVIGRKNEQTSHSLGPLPDGRRHSGRIATKHAMGIIAAEELSVDVKAGDWWFPTNHFALDSGNGRAVDRLEGSLSTNACARSFGPALYEGALDAEVPNFLDLNVQPSVFEPRPPKWLEVYVGHAEIGEWLEQDFAHFRPHQVNAHEYNKLAKALGIPRTEILGEEDFRHKQTEFAEKTESASA